MTIREFRANLAQHMNDIRNGKVIKVGTIHIGLIIDTTAKPKPVPTTARAETPIATPTVVEANDDELAEHEGVVQSVCKKCGKPKNEVRYTWVDGEKQPVCVDCVMAMCGKGWAGVWNKLERTA